MWAELDDLDCPCIGSGWADVSAPDVWEACPIHFHGQLYPEIRIRLLHDPKRLFEEERKSLLQYQISQAKASINELSLRLKDEKNKLFKLELELINKTPTVPAFAAVHLDDPEVEIK